MATKRSRDIEKAERARRIKREFTYVREKEVISERVLKVELKVETLYIQRGKTGWDVTEVRGRSVAATFFKPGGPSGCEIKTCPLESKKERGKCCCEEDGSFNRERDILAEKNIKRERDEVTL